jgi:hypothetical protein
MVLGWSSGPCESCWVNLRYKGATKLRCNLPKSQPKSYPMTSIEPINSMLIHTIISWHVQMMIINGFGVVIAGPCESCWVRFVVRGATKLSFDFPKSKPKSYLMTSIEPINSMLIHTIISWHVQMMIINGFGVVIAGPCESCWVRFVVRGRQN